MTAMGQTERDALRKLAEAATQGDWCEGESFYPQIREVYGASFKISVVLHACDITEEEVVKREADLRHIAAFCPSKVIELLDAMDAQAQRIVELEEEVLEAERGPWAEWSLAIMKSVRDRSGYDGFDDQDGVDLPVEVEEHLRETDQIIEKLTESNTALRAELEALRGQVVEAFVHMAKLAMQEPVGVVDEGDDGLFADLETSSGVMVKRGDSLYAAPVAPAQPAQGVNAELVDALEKLQKHDFELRSKTGDGFAPYVCQIIDDALDKAAQQKGGV